MAAKFQLVSEYPRRATSPKRSALARRWLCARQELPGTPGSYGHRQDIHSLQYHRPAPETNPCIGTQQDAPPRLYKEFGFFPHNAVCYFISYYDYYQPEAYIPQRDIYIEKDASINENIDRLRLAATGALVSREDVIIVASVSCIYGLGSPADYKRMMVYLPKGEVIDRDNLLLRLIDIQYQRNDVAFERGKFRVRGDTIDVWPASEEFAYRIGSSAMRSMRLQSSIR